MKFYYTTSAGTGEAQNKIINSIGGYKSSTPVPNNRINNLFGAISSYTINTNQDQYIALYLTNETGGDITGLSLYFTFPEDTYSNMEIGAVTPGQDAEGEDYIERLQDFYSEPYSVDFYGANGVDNAVSLGDLTNGSSLGIFFKRSINIDDIKEDYTNRISKEDNIYVEADLNTEDSTGIVLTWD